MDDVFFECRSDSFLSYKVISISKEEYRKILTKEAYNFLLFKILQFAERYIAIYICHGNTSFIVFLCKFFS